MFGLSDADRELDRDLFPWPVGAFALVVLVGTVVLGFKGVMGPKPPKPLQNSVAYGCYRSDGQDDIRVDAKGFSIREQGLENLPYLVDRGKQGGLLELQNNISISAADGTLKFGDEGQMRGGLFRLSTKNGGGFVPDYNQEPVAGLWILGPSGYVKYTRGPLSECEA